MEKRLSPRVGQVIAVLMGVTFLATAAAVGYILYSNDMRTTAALALIPFALGIAFIAGGLGMNPEDLRE